MSSLEVESLCVRYGQIEALHNLDLTLEEGEVVVVVGPNGAGKSSLMNAVSGVVPVSAGRVRFRGADITRTPAHRIARRGLVQVPEGRRIFAALTVEENLLIGAYSRRGRVQRQDLARIESMFPILAERRTSPAGLLSGGEQQMLAFARALMSKPRVVCMDEPTMGLSPLFVDRVLDTVVRLNRELGVTAFMVEQNAELALSIAHRGYLLATGDLVLSGPAGELVDNPKIRETYLGKAVQQD
jgi:branched-chain amino acid transport system ATP-binding protein